MESNINIEKKVKDIIEELTGQSPELGQSLRYDLGMDSLDKVELDMRIEKDFSIKITDDESESVQTVTQLIDLITNKVNG